MGILHDVDQEERVPVLGNLPALEGQRVVRDCKVDNGNSQPLLHLSVKCNHLDVSRVVLDSTGDDGEARKMINSPDNTILHLTVMLQRAEIVRFSLEPSPRVKTGVINTANGMDFSALDVQNHSPEDNKTNLQEIREIQVEGAGAENNVRPSHPIVSADDDQRKLGEDGAVEEIPAKEQGQIHESRNTWRTWVWLRLKWLMDYRGDWMNETRGSLMMVSSIIATVTFAAAISPPGGVWQQDTTNSTMTYPCDDGKMCPVCNENTPCYAGSAVLAYYYHDDFIKFMNYNMISFISSLVVLFLLISGFPLHNKFCLWLLSLAMCVTTSFLGLTFLRAWWLVLPSSNLLDQYVKFKDVTFKVWLAMICVVGLCLLIRLSSWLVRIYNGTHFKSAWARLLGFSPAHRSCSLKILSRTGKCVGVQSS